MNYTELTTTQVLKKRFKAIQKELKQRFCIKISDFRKFVIENDADFDTPQGWKLIENQWYNRTPNIRLVELLEDYRNSLLK